MGAGVHDLVVESGVLKDRHVVITVNEDGTASNYVEGGMWLVTGAWTVRELLSSILRLVSCHNLNFIITTH